MMLRKPLTSFRDDNFGAGTNIKDAWPGSEKHRFLKYMVDEWLMSPHTISSYMLGQKKGCPSTTSLLVTEPPWIMLWNFKDVTKLKTKKNDQQKIKNS